ncbi:MAG: bactofilin family protein [Candidatus Wenzhouxiangella sp. M2_3B_020]
MFNKRENQDPEAAERRQESATPSASERPREATSSAGGRSQPAVIGPSIAIDGELTGEEDVIVEGRIKGTVSLRQNTLTVGQQGQLDAEIYANTILVDGTVKGDLYAAERISIRKSARIDGNILAPRISLEDGARFRGTIDMDPESEAFRKAFGKSSSGASATPVKAASSGSDKGERKGSPASSGDTASAAPESKSATAKTGGSAA